MKNEKNTLINSTDFAILPKFVKKNKRVEIKVKTTEAHKGIYDGRPTISEEVLKEMVAQKIAKKSEHSEDYYIVKVWGECSIDWSKVIVSKNRPWEIKEIYTRLNGNAGETINNVGYWDIAYLKAVRNIIKKDLGI